MGRDKTSLLLIKNTWGKMRRDERLVFANQLMASLTGNAYVPMPNPTLVDFAAKIADAQAKREAVAALETQLQSARIAEVEAQDADQDGRPTARGTRVRRNAGARVAEVVLLK